MVPYYLVVLWIYSSSRSTNSVFNSPNQKCSDSFASQAQCDFALDNAMKINLHPSISARLIIGYDIWCQYGVHLLERFRHFEHLDFPTFLEELTGIVGAWHIFAHVRECFGRNSGIYVWGIGFIEMEILETLWSTLNMVTDSCRNMSRANREETINFNMNDMNLKKIRNLSACNLM